MRYDGAAQLLLTDDGQNLARAYAGIRTRSARLGLIGIARELAKEITSILLASCETFYLRVTQAGVARREAGRASPIEQLYLDRQDQERRIRAAAVRGGGRLRPYRSYPTRARA